MKTPRDRAEELFKADRRKQQTDKRDTEFFALRRAQEAANQEKTRRLRELRLAHEAANPKPEKPARKRGKRPPTE